MKAKVLRPWRLFIGLLAACVPFSYASATDVRVTGFATAGFAVLDKHDVRYLRHIDERGSFKADSLIGGQLEGIFSPRWSATVQAVASSSRNRDEGYEATLRWAFVSFRPSNDWLLRIGRLRAPVFFHTQNAEVGVTYDEARLPVEVYSTSPVYDVDGAAATKTWALADREINLDAYWGRTKLGFRLPFQRDPTHTVFPHDYFPETITFKGLVLSHTAASVSLRAGLHHAVIVPRGDRQFQDFVPTSLPAPAPFGGTLYVPGRIVKDIAAKVVTLGAEWRSGDWRLTAEYGQRIFDNNVGADSKSAYVTGARRIGNWTPYVTYARLLSGSDTRTNYRQLNATPVPLGAQAPPLSLPANYHRILADHVWVYDQYSTMVGAAYSFSATSKLKLEWMRTHVGLASALVDGDFHDRHFNVYSISYSVAF